MLQEDKSAETVWGLGGTWSPPLTPGSPACGSRHQSSPSGSGALDWFHQELGNINSRCAQQIPRITALTVPRPPLVDQSSRRALRDCDVTALLTLACVLQAPDEAALSSLSETLTQAGVAHKLWVEQPENIPTCLALKPCPKDAVQQLLRKFKLFK